MIPENRKLVKMFMQSAAMLLKENDKVIITHKAVHPFKAWNLEESANAAQLQLVKSFKFNDS
jgi:hypothetical protein